MAKLRCVCGYVITTSGEIPNRDEWLYISDVDYARFGGSVHAEALYRAFGHAFVCPVSGHIWIFRRGFEEDPECYAPLNVTAPVEDERSSETVRTHPEFVRFVKDLTTELSERPESWENQDLGRFLEALGAWLQDSPGFFQNRGEAMPSQPTWSFIATLLRAGSRYE